jgi:hypothetical protein
VQTPLDQAPLTTLDAKYSQDPIRPTPPRTGQYRQIRPRALACFQKTDAIVIEQVLPPASADKRAAPHCCRAKSWCPEAQRSGSAAARPSTSADQGHTRRWGQPAWKGATAPLRGARLSAQRHQFQGPSRSFPEGIRLAAETEDGTSQHQLQNPVTQASRGHRLAADS